MAPRTPWLCVANLIVMPILLTLTVLIADPARRAHAHTVSTATSKILYQADARRGWAGWKAPGWAIDQGDLVSSGQRGEIRIPYVPAVHGISDYRVVVNVAQIETVAPPPSGPHAPVEPGFAIRLRRSGPYGYSLHAYNCDYSRCLVLRTLPAHRWGSGDVLKENSWEESGNLGGSQIKFAVTGTYLSGSWVDPDARDILRVHARNARFTGGGYASIYADPDTRIVIARVSIRSVR